MAILQEHPASFSLALFDHLSCDTFLTLAQALIKEFVLEVHLLRKCKHLLGGVCSLAQDEDNWGFTVRITEESIHSCNGTFSVLLSELILHIALECKQELLWLKNLEDQELVEEGDPLIHADPARHAVYVVLIISH